MLTDGKPYKLENRTNDKEANIRWASGRCAKGYKLHVVIDQGHRLLGWALHPMNHGETTACAKIIEKFPKQDRKNILVGDAGYISNPLHAMSASRNIRLIAPQTNPGTGLGNRKHHQDRIASVRLTEDRGGWMWPMLRARRSGVERCGALFFGLGDIVCGCWSSSELGLKPASNEAMDRRQTRHQRRKNREESTTSCIILGPGEAKRACFYVEKRAVRHDPGGHLPGRSGI